MIIQIRQLLKLPQFLRLSLALISKIFSKVAIFAAISLVLSVAAAPGGSGNNHSKCNIGPIQCCEQLHIPETIDDNKISSIIGVAVDPITVLTGEGCSPVSVLGVGSGTT
ncbi:hypothetical protein BDZ94DRAFT_1218239 [Collybia nuda]|uniref:Hydrophobin n=1 Tax=Collybia nuda TaxID=64659 RepID=A0A9P5Y8N2_9AGAR|nr:hypothetical protein BDZ94DRAFT_1218239 [Collybia nuda]